jgi:GntR family transcriptional repressor for pyruvate dehydrogenase complex
MSKAKVESKGRQGPRKPVAAVPGRPALPGRRRTNKVSDVVALDIVRNIVALGLSPGSRLPLEAQLMERHRVSRASLREALRLLEVQGLIHTRPGPNGGSFVGHVHVASLARTVTMHMHLLGTTYDELLAAWALTEAVQAQLAAAHPDRALVQRLMEPFLAPLAEDSHAMLEGLHFHDRVGVLANNRVLSFVLSIPGAIVAEHIVNTLRRETLEPRIVHDHARIAAAIIAGNAQKAYWVMQEHVEDMVKLFRDAWPSAIGEKIEWR